VPDGYAVKPMRPPRPGARFRCVSEVSAPESAPWSRGRWPGGWTWLDAALATFFLFVLVSEIVPNPEMTPHALLVVLSVPTTLPLAWRTWFAGQVAVLVAASHFVMCLVATGPFSPQLAVLPLLVALYSAGSRIRGWPAVAVGGITLVLTVASWLVIEEGDADDFWPWMLWAGAWATGTFVRRRSDLAARHAGRAALLEVEARTVAAESAQQERDRIARELHDVVAHSVSLMVVQAGAERLRLGPDAGRTGVALEAIEGAGRSALAELRTMLGVMRDRSGEELAPLPSLAQIPLLVERVRDAGLPVELTSRPPGLLGEAEARHSSGAVGLAAYRIVQEALTNVVRHDGPVPTSVCLEREPDRLTVTVRNQSPSRLQQDGSGAGRGLVGMRERATALGGRFEAGPGADGGFQVVAVLPLRATWEGR
jgi:signal transduction histidine kinase